MYGCIYFGDLALYNLNSNISDFLYIFDLSNAEDTKNASGASKFY
jgi:hypothetical protein